WPRHVAGQIGDPLKLIHSATVSRRGRLPPLRPRHLGYQGILRRPARLTGRYGTAPCAGEARLCRAIAGAAAQVADRGGERSAPHRPPPGPRTGKPSLARWAPRSTPRLRAGVREIPFPPPPGISGRPGMREPIHPAIRPSRPFLSRVITDDVPAHTI